VKEAGGKPEEEDIGKPITELKMVDVTLRGDHGGDARKPRSEPPPEGGGEEKKVGNVRAPAAKEGGKAKGEGQIHLRPLGDQVDGDVVVAEGLPEGPRAPKATDLHLDADTSHPEGEVVELPFGAPILKLFGH